MLFNANDEFFLWHIAYVKYTNQEYSKAFGEHLRKLRLEKGFGMREFAREADIEYSQLSKIELGISNPTIATVLMLAETLGVSHTEMYEFKFPGKGKKI